MDARNYELDEFKADFYQCLAAALMPPMDDALAQAMLGGDLVGDLADLDREIGYGLTGEIHQLQAELDAVGDPKALLMLYSQLFLAPPRKVNLNAAIYLDGSFNGGTVTELEQCYADHGVIRADHFHDLADHVTVQLEFIAHLFRKSVTSNAITETSAGHFISHYPERWIVPLVEDIKRISDMEGFVANPYRQLLRLLEAAVLHDAEDQHEALLSPTERRERALSLARQRRAERAISAAELKEIRRRLEDQGLSAAHLDPDRKDDPFAGWEAMVPPSPKR